MDPHEEEALGKAYDGRLMRRFLRYIRPHWPLAAISLFFIFARIGMDLVGPWILRAAVDGPIARKDAAGLLPWVLLFAGSIAGMALFEVVETWVTNLGGQRIIRDLRLQVFSHLQRLPMAFYDKTPVGRLVVRVTNDVENLNELFTSGIVAFFADIFLLGGVLAMMFALSWKLTLVCLACSPLLLAIVLVFRRFAREAYRDVRQRIARLNAYLNESVNGVRTIQMFTREEACGRKFNDLNAAFRTASNRAILLYSFFYPGVELVSSVSVALLVWYGGWSILEGTLSFGSFLAFWYCAQKFFQPIRDLSEKYNILQAAMASSERLFKLLDTPPAPGGRSPAATSVSGEIAFENVSFSYDDRTPVLRDITFHIRPGERLAIVGATGAGKTTIINLLLRLYDATSGHILIDGRDVRDLDPQALRRSIGLVLQDVFLFQGTVEDNIRLGDSAVARGRVETAARIANADRFITRLPKGYDTDVRERGTALSTGERQLLSFARALATDPRILVLDEATSSVDSESEALIQEALERLLAGRTSIVIAHRLSTIRNADRILVLHDGRITEHGRHEELLSRDGLYSKLVRLQFDPVEYRGP
ncbi:MAG: ABC transporter ATP-binding protein [Planctomycetes bacterium]|nr:ABC transporter ATP-binding protein [Planctomycetota bacterium]